MTVGLARVEEDQAMAGPVAGTGEELVESWVEATGVVATVAEMVAVATVGAKAAVATVGERAVAATEVEVRAVVATEGGMAAVATVKARAEVAILEGSQGAT